MKIRRKIEAPGLRTRLHFEFKYFSLAQNFYYNSQFFNHFTGVVLFTLGCVLLGIFWPIFWGIGLSNLGLLVFLYFKTARLAEGITVKRVVPGSAREQEMIEVQYEISNQTGFEFNDLHFYEEFDGLQAGRMLVTCHRPIPAQTRFTLKQKIQLDGGMGIKTFQPIRIYVRDPLGIFEFPVKFLQTSEIEVHPRLEPTPSLKTSISPEAIDFGFYEINKRGDSNLFIGTREYRHGDPVRMINWKLSQKFKKVVVNEFEKNTSSYVTLLMDLCLNTQLGSGELSTWEMAKDLALSIAANEIRKNNHIQVVSHNLYIPFASGKSQFNAIEKHFTLHELAQSAGLSHLQYLHNLPANSQIYFICPMLTSPRLGEIIRALKNLKMAGHAVTIFAIDPYQQLQKEIKGQIRIGLMEMNRHARTEFDGHTKELALAGIKLVLITVDKGKPVGQQILKEAWELISS
jgi:uncharacterized protein (DUF58 family)